MSSNRAYRPSNSCSQVILVYLHPFRRSTFFCRQNLWKKSLKNLFLGH